MRSQTVGDSPQIVLHDYYALIMQAATRRRWARQSTGTARCCLAVSCQATPSYGERLQLTSRRRTTARRIAAGEVKRSSSTSCSLHWLPLVREAKNRLLARQRAEAGRCQARHHDP